MTPAPDDEHALGARVRVAEHFVLTGSCSWTDRTLVAETDWYPKRTMSAEERLRFYAQSFPIVEVDSTYYAPASEQNSIRWVQRTPPGFLFNIKAYGLLTRHAVQVRSLAPEVRQMLPSAALEKKQVYMHELPKEARELVWTMHESALRPLAVLLDTRAAEKARTPITAELYNVPLDTAVRLLAGMVDLQPVRVDNVLFVTSPQTAEALESVAPGASTIAATRAAVGTMSLNSSRRLAPNSGCMRLIPVMFPPGRARLSTRPRTVRSPYHRALSSAAIWSFVIVVPVTLGVIVYAPPVGAAL